jgi:hypothetical protein
VNRIFDVSRGIDLRTKILEIKKMKILKLLLLLFFGFNCSVFSQWVQTGATPTGGGITDMVMTDAGTLIVTTASYNYNLTGHQWGGIRRSTDGGDSWNDIINNYTARTLAISWGGHIFASSWPFPGSEALWRSTDDGQTFFQVYPVGAGNNIFSIVAPSVDNSIVYIGTRNGVLKSTNFGNVFIPVNNGIPANSWVRDLECDSSGTIAAATTNGLFISTNEGSSWQQTSGIQAGDTIVKLCFDYPLETDGSQVVSLSAGSNNGNMYRALADSGASYLFGTLIAVFGDGEISGLGIAILRQQNKKVHGVTTFGGNGSNSGFSKSTNNGANWTQMISGMPQERLVSAMLLGEIDPLLGTVIFYAGFFNNTSNGAQIYKLEKTIGIQTLSSQIPEGFSLSQNYPNPFNPSTKIKFAIPNSSFVKLAVYDMLGREAALLVNKQLSPGTYEYEFNASELRSGTYFYRLKSDEFSEIKKMILIK